MQIKNLKRWGRTVVTAGAAVMLTLGGLMVTGPPAQALCSNFGCNATDPQATGCAASAVNAGTKRFRIFGYDMGVVQGRYSKTCKSQWTRLYYEDVFGVHPTLSHIGMYNGPINYSGPFGSTATSWWTAQAGAEKYKYYHSGVVKFGAYYGATGGPW